jgi:hypothetical protein
VPLLSGNPSSLISTRISVLDHDQLGAAVQAYSASAYPGSATVTSNRARFVPIVIHRSCTAYRMIWLGAGGASGNCEVGIYTESGTRLVTSGAVACTPNINVVDIPDTELSAGRYYLAHALSSSTQTVTVAVATINYVRSLGCGNASSAIPLPATVTLAGSMVEGNVPYLCVDVRGL